ncbi:hypothetical protein FOA52_007928 [Chlamydomonas sp. UWO 241]|nr:hypothetical protein FOA52_007928 [Chlamydomonas sp. UWO 241]
MEEVIDCEEFAVYEDAGQAGGRQHLDTSELPDAGFHSHRRPLADVSDQWAAYYQRVLDEEEALLKSPATGGAAHPARPRAGVPCASPTRSSPAPSRMGPGRAVVVVAAVQQQQPGGRQQLLQRTASLPPRPPSAAAASPFGPPPLIIVADAAAGSTGDHHSGSSGGAAGSSRSGQGTSPALGGSAPYGRASAAFRGSGSGAPPFEHGGPSDDEARAHGAFMAHLSQQTAQLELAHRGAAGSSAGCGGAGGRARLPAGAAGKAAAVRRLLR